MRNFISKQIFLLFLTFGYAASTGAQTFTITGTCSSVVVTSTPAWDTNLYALANTSGNDPCTKLASNPNGTMKASYTLQLKGSNGTWTTVTTLLSAGNPTFSSLSSGIFRVTVKLPTKAVGCSNGVVVINSLGQSIGFIGVIVPNPILTSNEITVGPTQPNDIKFNFVDNNGTNSNDLAWDLTEAKIINTSGTITGSYDRYWLAIIEQSTPKRYWSQGWTFAQIPTNIDIGIIWNSSVGPFNQFGSYLVQLAASTGCNSSWVEAVNSQGSNTFFICPTGSGCKGTNIEENITLAPNPTNVSFRIMGIDTEVDYSLVLIDLAGKNVKTFSNISNQDLDVSELSAGMYIAQLWNGTKKVQSKKLSIVK